MKAQKVLFTLWKLHYSAKSNSLKDCRPLDELINNGQVFTQYVDDNNQITMESPFNPNGSMYAIEGILSADGRIIGKMGHSERQGKNRFKNIYGEMDQLLFESGVNFFKKN